MTLRHIVGLLTLLGSAWLAFFADKTPGADGDLVTPTRASMAIPTTPSPSPATTAQARATLTNSKEAATAVPMVLALDERLAAPRPDAVRHGAEAFGVLSWTPPPPPPPPPPVPRAPPLPFVFLGKQQQAGAWQVYLSVGEDMRLARVASVIDGQYRVDAIVPPRIEFTYLPLNERQTLDIGAP